MIESPKREMNWPKEKTKNEKNFNFTITTAYPSLSKEREAKQGELEKKIEELTLHLIEKDQEIKRMKSDQQIAIDSLIKRLEKLEND